MYKGSSTLINIVYLLQASSQIFLDSIKEERKGEKRENEEENSNTKKEDEPEADHKTKIQHNKTRMECKE